MCEDYIKNKTNQLNIDLDIMKDKLLSKVENNLKPLKVDDQTSAKASNSEIS
jgi:hypothetical protein